MAHHLVVHIFDASSSFCLWNCRSIEDNGGLPFSDPPILSTWLVRSKSMKHCSYPINIALQNHYIILYLHMDDTVVGDISRVGKSLLLEFSNITFRYLLRIASPILSWCSSRKFAKPCIKAHYTVKISPCLSALSSIPVNPNKYYAFSNNNHLLGFIV